MVRLGSVTRAVECRMHFFSFYGRHATHPVHYVGGFADVAEVFVK